MSKRELVTREVRQLPDTDLDKLLAYIRSLKQSHGEAAMPTLAAESSLTKDWLTSEEELAWAGL